MTHIELELYAGILKVFKGPDLTRPLNGFRYHYHQIDGYRLTQAEAENDPMISPALEEGLHKDKHFMRSPEMLECYIEVAQMGGNTQLAHQIYLKQANRTDLLLLRYSLMPLHDSFSTFSLNSLAGLPDNVLRHTLEIDGHTPRQAEEYLRKLSFQFEVNESGDWVCCISDGICVLACSNCDKWYMHNPVDCDKPCRMCHMLPDKHTLTCIRYKAWACKHNIQIPPDPSRDCLSTLQALSTSQALRRPRPGDRRCLQMLDNSRLSKCRLTPDQSSRMLAIIEQFARIAAEAGSVETGGAIEIRR